MHLLALEFPTSALYSNTQMMVANQPMNRPPPSQAHDRLTRPLDLLFFLAVALSSCQLTWLATSMYWKTHASSLAATLVILFLLLRWRRCLRETTALVVGMHRDPDRLKVLAVTYFK